MTHGAREPSHRDNAETEGPEATTIVYAIGLDTRTDKRISIYADGCKIPAAAGCKPNRSGLGIPTLTASRGSPQPYYSRSSLARPI